MSKCRCVACKKYFPKDDMMTLPVGALCSQVCVHALIESKREKSLKQAIKYNKAQANKRLKAYKKETVRLKKTIKTRTKWYNDLQSLVNQYVTKVRDKDKGCCTCGKTNDVKYDAGHCFTRAARPDIRFDLRNIHKQCSVNCNQHGSGMVNEYKQFIVKSYGQDELDRLTLEGKPLKERFHHWSDIEDEIIRYRKLLRDNGIKPNT